MYQGWIDQVEEYMNGHRQELVDCVCRLVNIPSVKGESLPDAPYGIGPKKALMEGLRICQENGLVPYNHENRCGSGIYQVNGAEKEIGFVAHLDVVPAGEGWTSDPFQGIERNGFIVGRGARDNKAGFAAALLAINCVRDLNVPLSSNIRLVMGCDEESGMSDMEYYAENCPLPDFSIVTDCYFPVAHGEKGIFHGDVVMPVENPILTLQAGTATNIIPGVATAQLDTDKADIHRLQEMSKDESHISITTTDNRIVISAEGISAHASEPEMARNAIYLLVDFLLRANVVTGTEEHALNFIRDALNFNYGEFFGIEYEDDISGKTTCIGGILSSSKNEIRLNLNIRYSVTDHHDRFYPFLQQCCEEKGYTFVLHEASAPHYIPGDRPEVVNLTNIYQRVSGDDRPAYVVAGGTYARKLPNSIAFGPGSKDEIFPYPPGYGDAHQPDESQSIDYLLMAAKIYALAIIELDEIINR